MDALRFFGRRLFHSVFVFLAIATGSTADGGTTALALKLVAAEIGIGARYDIDPIARSAASPRSVQPTS